MISYLYIIQFACTFSICARERENKSHTEWKPSMSCLFWTVRMHGNENNVKLQVCRTVFTLFLIATLHWMIHSKMMAPSSLETTLKKHCSYMSNCLNFIWNTSRSSEIQNNLSFHGRNSMKFSIGIGIFHKSNGNQFSFHKIPKLKNLIENDMCVMSTTIAMGQNRTETPEILKNSTLYIPKKNKNKVDKCTCTSNGIQNKKKIFFYLFQVFVDPFCECFLLNCIAFICDLISWNDVRPFVPIDIGEKVNGHRTAKWTAEAAVNSNTM